MRALIRQLEEATPAPGSKEWLAGVKKWWGQWVKDAERISKIRDSKDRKVALAWFADGEDRIALLIDTLVRRMNFETDPALARITVGATEYKDGVTLMKVPRTYTIDGEKFRPDPRELVHSHLNAASDSLDSVRDQEGNHWEVSQGSDSERRWGTTKDLDEWQSYLEMLPHDIKGIDADVQAALRKFAAELKAHPSIEKNIDKSIPLDYDLGGVKVITDPGSLHDLGMLTGMDAKRDPNLTRVSFLAAERVQDGLRLAQRALQQRGFGKLWYGNIFVLPRTKAITATTAKTGISFKAGGHYGTRIDNVVLNPTGAQTAHSMAEVVVHELGHRYWFKHMKAGARARFAAWFDPRSKEDQERDGAQADFVPAPTAYGAESPVEEFAEIFAAYVLGKYQGITLTGPQKARFEALALGRAAQSESRLAILSRMIEDDGQ